MAVTASMPRETLNTFSVLARRWLRTVDEPARRWAVDATALAHGSFEPASAALAESTSVRQSRVRRIDAPLHVLRPRAEGAQAWVRQRKTAQLFAGATALALMLRVWLGDVGGGADDLADSCCADLS